MALCDEKCTSGHMVSVFPQVCLQFSSRVVRHGFDVKSCCGLPGHERKKNSVVHARSSRDSCRAEPDCGQGTRLVDVLCGEESDTPQGSEPVAKQARTDDYSMNVGQVTPPVVPGRETKELGGSVVEFLRQLVKEQQAQLNEAVRAANAATQAAAAATQALNAQQANLAMMQASTAQESSERCT